MRGEQLPDLESIEDLMETLKGFEDTPVEDNTSSASSISSISSVGDDYSVSFPDLAEEVELAPEPAPAPRPAVRRATPKKKKKAKARTAARKPVSKPVEDSIIHDPNIYGLGAQNAGGNPYSEGPFDFIPVARRPQAPQQEYIAAPQQQSKEYIAPNMSIEHIRGYLPTEQARVGLLKQDPATYFAQEEEAIVKTAMDSVDWVQSKLLRRSVLDTTTGKNCMHDYRLSVKYRAGGFMPHLEFLRLSERIEGFQVNYDRNLIEKALGVALKQALPICIPISSSFFHSHDFIRDIATIYSENEGFPDNVYFELNEDVLLPGSTTAKAKKCFEIIKRFGAKIAIANFGHRIFEYAYIPNFSIDLIKISPELVHYFEKDVQVRSKVYDILAYSNLKKTELVAYGVDTIRQENIFKELGCTKMQGLVDFF